MLLENDPRALNYVQNWGIDNTNIIIPLKSEPSSLKMYQMSRSGKRQKIKGPCIPYIDQYCYIINTYLHFALFFKLYFFPRSFVFTSIPTEIFPLVLKMIVYIKQSENTQNALINLFPIGKFTFICNYTSRATDTFALIRNKCCQLITH